MTWHAESNPIFIYTKTINNKIIINLNLNKCWLILADTHTKSDIFNRYQQLCLCVYVCAECLSKYCEVCNPWYRRSHKKVFSQYINVCVALARQVCEHAVVADVVNDGCSPRFYIWQWLHICQSIFYLNIYFKFFSAKTIYMWMWNEKP